MFTSKTKSYATAHLLHPLCSAVRRHAGSRVSNNINHQIGNTGWTGMRAYHDQALIDEFQRRGIEASAIYDGNAISFVHPVMYELADNMLVTIS